MKSNEKLWAICVEIYTKAYKESEPPLDFKAVLKRTEAGEQMEQCWFYNHYLDPKRWDAIVKDAVAKHKLNEREAHRVSKEVNLGCGPTGVKKKA